MDTIKIKFPDGTVREYPKGIRPIDIVKDLDGELREKAVVAKASGKLIDLTRPLNEDTDLKILTWDDEEGMETYWHSTAHIMAHAVKELFPEAKFAIGPPIDTGFYYDIDLGKSLGPEDLEHIEEKMWEIIAADEPFIREELPKDQAIELFKQRNESYKLEILAELKDDHPSIYREGNFVDLCTGPHLPSTAKVKYFKLLNVAGAYWRGDEHNPMLQRIYGVSFPTKEQLDDLLRRLEEAKRRDHRRLGKELGLFSFHLEGPGLVFWHPKGTIIYNEIVEYLRAKLQARGYGEVRTPMMLNEKLWERSGHLAHYKENMYFVDVIEEETYAVKPMNCPGACLIYSTELRSYRDLPLRLAEFGLVHRHERSGVLSGLLRVRAFTQDDAHIYCTPDQVLGEVIDLLDFVQEVYSDFGFSDYRVELSTRPPKSIGTDESWQQGESALQAALEAKGVTYQLNPGEGAFYGPKIDFHLRDSLGRSWQCGTIQLDFFMPERFDLEYVGPDGRRHRPVMIHRAIFGSIERFIAQLIEHYAGAFPVWIAPIQVAVLPITDDQREYAHRVAQALKERNLRVQVDDRNEKIGYRIREGEVQKIPYMLIVGKKEVERQTVAVRKRKAGDLGESSLEDFVQRVTLEIRTKALE